MLESGTKLLHQPFLDLSPLPGESLDSVVARISRVSFITPTIDALRERLFSNFANTLSEPNLNQLLVGGGIQSRKERIRYLEQTTEILLYRTWNNDVLHQNLIFDMLSSEITYPPNAIGKVEIRQYGGYNRRFCPKCVDEDLSHYGVSYWRRDHQLVGVYLCTAHNVILERVYQPKQKIPDKAGVSDLPYDYLYGAKAHCPVITEDQYIEHEDIIRKFADFVTLLLRQDMPTLSRVDMWGQIVNRLQALSASNRLEAYQTWSNFTRFVRHIETGNQLNISAQTRLAQQALFSSEPNVEKNVLAAVVAFDHQSAPDDAPLFPELPVRASSSEGEAFSFSSNGIYEALFGEAPQEPCYEEIKSLAGVFAERALRDLGFPPASDAIIQPSF